MWSMSCLCLKTVPHVPWSIMIKAKLHIRLTIPYRIWTHLPPQSHFFFPTVFQPHWPFFGPWTALNFLSLLPGKLFPRSASINGPSPTTQTKADLKFANPQFHHGWNCLGILDGAKTTRPAAAFWRSNSPGEGRGWAEPRLHVCREELVTPCTRFRFRQTPSPTVAKL